MAPKKKAPKELPEWGVDGWFLKKLKTSTTNSSLATTTNSSPLDTPEIAARTLEGASSDLEAYEVQQQWLDLERDDADERDSLPDAPIPETIIWHADETPSPPPSKKDEPIITQPRLRIPTYVQALSTVITTNKHTPTECEANSYHYIIHTTNSTAPTE